VPDSPTNTTLIGARCASVRERIAAAAGRAGRAPDSITLVVVTKTFGVDAVDAAIAAGARDLGENYVQEAAEKIATLGGQATSSASTRPRWHFIGHLQRNKAARAVSLFDRIHTLDSTRLAQELDRAATRTGRTLRVLVEVNVGNQSTKRGLPPDEIRDFLRAIAPMQRLTVDGLMAIPPMAPDPEASRPYFRQLATLADALKADGFDLPHLSMGMTDDFEIAIEEGATIVRVGRAIFGPRATRGPAPRKPG
jgi:pyridoxal phosphate enzyme (YggS family)